MLMTTLGEMLRSAREEQNITLADAEHETRIRSRILVALEGDDATEMPAPVYARGLLRNYADYLKLDPQEVISTYEKQYAPSSKSERRPLGGGSSSNTSNGSQPTVIRPSVTRLPASTGTIRTELRYPPSILAVLVVVVILAFAAIFVYNLVASNKPAPIPAVVNSTAVASPIRLAAATSTVAIGFLLPTPTSAISNSVAVPPTAASPLLASPTSALPNPSVGQGTPAVSPGIYASPTNSPVGGSQPLAPTATTTATPASAKTTPVPGQVSLSLRATSPSWIQVRVDGVQVYQGTLQTGQTRQFAGKQTIYLSTGNPGGLYATYNGQGIGVLGAIGKPLSRTFTAAPS